MVNDFTYNPTFQDLDTEDIQDVLSLDLHNHKFIDFGTSGCSCSRSAFRQLTGTNESEPLFSPSPPTPKKNKSSILIHNLFLFFLYNASFLEISPPKFQNITSA